MNLSSTPSYVKALFSNQKLSNQKSGCKIKMWTVHHCLHIGKPYSWRKKLYSGPKGKGNTAKWTGKTEAEQGTRVTDWKAAKPVQTPSSHDKLKPVSVTTPSTSEQGSECSMFGCWDLNRAVNTQLHIWEHIPYPTCFPESQRQNHLSKGQAGHRAPAPGGWTQPNAGSSKPSHRSSCCPAV